VPVVAVCSSPRTGSARSVSRVPSGRRLTEAYQPQVSPTGVMVTNVPVSGPAPGSGSASRHHQGLEDDSSRRSMRGICAPRGAVSYAPLSGERLEVYL
jgi:hypothetical protein